MSATEDLSSAERYDLATKLITQSPPGQVNDVIAAIQVIVDDHSPEFKAQVLLRLGEYHRSQLQNHTLEASNRPTLISEAACLSKEESRYVDPNTSRSYALDHFTLTASDIQPHQIRSDFESFRSHLDVALTNYLSNHYSTSESYGSVVCSARPAKIKQAAAQPVPEPKDEDVAVVGGGVGSGDAEGSVVEPITEDVKPEPVISTEDTPPSEDSPTATTTTTEQPPTSSDSDAPAPTSTGVVNTISSAIVETVEQVKEVINADTPAAALSTRESDALVNDPESSNTEAADKEEKNVQAVVAGTENANISEEPKNTAVEPETTTAQPEPAVAEETEPEFEDEDPKYTVHIVSNKYNTKNFWTGRWRSIWTVDPAQKSIHGEIHVDVHYFEAGNVQLATNQSFDLPLPASVEKDQAGAGKIINAIAQLEAEYQLKLGETNQQFADKEFRSLRRALPITRSRMDWDKVSAYRLRSKAN